MCRIRKRDPGKDEWSAGEFHSVAPGLAPHVESGIFSSVSPAEESCPRRGSPATRAIARALLRLGGWRIVGELPARSRFVLIVAPHTSNWDFLICILAMFGLGLRLSWLGKHSLFRFPAGSLLRWLGGEPLDRRATQGTVEAAIARFRSRKQWVLGLSPEGTRGRTERWKTGFHRIAVGAGVPILPVALDYGQRTLTLRELFWPGEDGAEDIARLHHLFTRSMALHPERFADLAPAADAHSET
ncbi:MAG TPA: lysophospholipid acyltransferase family protein [Gemmatimonadales bacterium]|nr:lysophospholipid acyltransferase family protein [Gemmatimonadales bacterium]